MKEPILYRIVRPIIKGLFIIIYRPKIVGRENIPVDTNFILAGTHTNFFDCLLLMSCTKKTIHFLAKDSLYKGIKKPIFKNMGIIPVNRRIHDGEALSSAIETLKSGGVVGIFPEGTINRTDDLIMDFKIGAVKMASETSTKIVPFAIKGKYKPFVNNLTIEFGHAYNVQKKDNLKEENQILMDKVKKLLTKDVK